jgi:hypothetical protein
MSNFNPLLEAISLVGEDVRSKRPADPDSPLRKALGVFDVKFSKSGQPLTLRLKEPSLVNGRITDERYFHIAKALGHEIRGAVGFPFHMNEVQSEQFMKQIKALNELDDTGGGILNRPEIQSGFTTLLQSIRSRAEGSGGGR